MESFVILVIIMAAGIVTKRL